MLECKLSTCKKEFEPKNDAQKYCSKACRLIDGRQKGKPGVQQTMTLPPIDKGLTIEPWVVGELRRLHGVVDDQAAINWLVDFWREVNDLAVYMKDDDISPLKLARNKDTPSYSGGGSDTFQDQDIRLLMDKPGIVHYFEVGCQSDRGRVVVELPDGTKELRLIRRVAGIPGGWQMGPLHPMDHITTEMAGPGGDRTIKVLQRDDRVFEIDLRDIPERPKYPDLTGMKVAAKMAAEEKYYQDMQNWELRYNPGP